MIYDYVIMNKITEELKEKLIGGIITKVMQPSALKIIMSIKQGNFLYNLLMSAESEHPGIYITEEKYTDKIPSLNFSLSLKKHIINGKILDMSLTPLERILTCHIKARDDIGELKNRLLVAEIMGKHSNIILLSQEDRNILGCIKHITSRVNRHREILPGEIYIAPPLEKKENPFHVEEETFVKMALSEGDLEKNLVKHFNGVSILIAKEIIVRAGLSADIGGKNLSSKELKNLYHIWKETWNEINESRTAYLYKAEGEEKPVWKLPLLYPLELKLLDSLQGETIKNFNRATDRGYKIQNNIEIFNREKKSLSDGIFNYKKKLKEDKRRLEEQLKKAQKWEEYKKKGDIILAHLHITPGGNTVELVDIFDEEQKKIVIDINPSLSMSQNGQAYFKKYKKSLKIMESAGKQMEDLKKEQEYIENICLSLELCETVKELREIKEELVENGLIKDKKPHEKKKDKDMPSFIQVTTEDGWTIMAGKNNRQNDMLTMKIAKGNDIWLHAKGIPGSHVIIRNPQALDISSIPYKTLHKGASLAAHYSKGKNSSHVPVDYTFVKYVKKPKGAKPGMVIYHGEKTLSVQGF
ncbi:MAG: NFACT RNA binding domain-containing protein [Candidatus Eremiobacterota bacterium]